VRVSLRCLFDGNHDDDPTGSGRDVTDGLFVPLFRIGSYQQSPSHVRIKLAWLGSETTPPTG
jgi:hypothetical protein